MLTCDSATAVLERFFGGPITVRRLPMAPLAPDAVQRARLALAADQAWAHRRVNLLAAGAVLSEADLWYVPGRLPTRMLSELRRSATPFGAVVRPLAPRRHSISATMVPSPAEPALDHRALLLTQAGPIAEVHERYPRHLASFGR